MARVSVPAPSPRPRRLATPSWLDLRLVIGVALVLASVLVGARVVSSARDTAGAVTATRDLAAGSILTVGDVRITQVQLPARGRGVYLSAVGAAVGKRLQRPVARDELVPVAAVTRVAAQTTLTVPLSAGAAPGLHPGQRIEVWVSTAACASVVLLPDVTVQSVRSDDGGSFSSGVGGQDVVVSVAPDVADRVIAALALDQVKLRAGVLVGSTGRSVTPGDLAACSSATASAAPSPSR
jgi:hypothetical protein